jgi:hypothetical protein
MDRLQHRQTLGHDVRVGHRPGDTRQLELWEKHRIANPQSQAFGETLLCAQVVGQNPDSSIRMIVSDERGDEGLRRSGDVVERSSTVTDLLEPV